LDVRRVVTGIDESGASAFVADEILLAVPGRSSGRETIRIWGRDRPPTIPDQNALIGPATFFPPPGGYRVYMLVNDPNQPDDVDPQRAAEADALLTDVAAHLDPKDPRMHGTPSVDFILILSGEVILELENGEKTLRRGDVVVQNGTRHKWRYAGDEPCVMLAVILGASED
jgi:mannose-6-phosphate isomerase-like protein (cupin superfamily)